MVKNSFFPLKKHFWNYSPNRCKYNKKTSELKIKLSKEEKEHVYNYYKADFVIFNFPK